MGARRVSHQRKCATVCCNLISVSATSGSLYTPKLCLSYSFLAWVSNCVPLSCYFCSWSTGWGTYSHGWSIGRGGAKDKTESQGLCNQRRATEISLCSFTSGKLNLWNQHDKSCPLGISEWTTSAPTTERGLVLAAVEVEGKYTWELGQIEVRDDPTLPTVHASRDLPKGIGGPPGEVRVSCDTDSRGLRKIVLSLLFMFHCVLLFYHFLKKIQYT